MFDLDLEESSGTRKLFQILIRLLDVVKNRKSIMMDEFDLGLHTRLADFILDLIHASDGSQLLFSSHNTNLIDVKRLRRDQIVFVKSRNMELRKCIHCMTSRTSVKIWMQRRDISKVVSMQYHTLTLLLTVSNNCWRDKLWQAKEKRHPIDGCEK